MSLSYSFSFLIGVGGGDMRDVCLSLFVDNLTGF